MTVRRGGTTITVADDKVVIETPTGANVYLGGESGAQQLATREFVEVIYNQHIHSTGVGPSGPPLVPPPLTDGSDITAKGRSQ